MLFYILIFICIFFTILCRSRYIEYFNFSSECSDIMSSMTHSVGESEAERFRLYFNWKLKYKQKMINFASILKNY